MSTLVKFQIVVSAAQPASSCTENSAMNFLISSTDLSSTNAFSDRIFSFQAKCPPCPFSCVLELYPLKCTFLDNFGCECFHI